MGTVRFIGEAIAVAQVDTLTPANVITADIFYATIVGWDGSTEIISVTATADTVANITGLFTAAWNASTHAECAKITATDSTTHITLTADTAGVAFTVTAAATEGGAPDTQTFTQATTTANVGPSDWTSLANWDTGAIPVAGDDVYIEGAFTILYGLAQSAVELDSLNISGARIGTNPKAGWRPVYLAVGSPIVEIGYHYGPSAVTQSVPVNLDVGTTVDVVATVHNSGSNGTKPAVRLTCKDDGDTLTIRKGSVGLYNNSSGDAQLATITMDYDTNKAGDVDLFIEAGWTIATINKNAGDLLLRTLTGKTIATLNIDGAGTVKTEGDGPITTINQKDNAGTSTLNSTGTVTTIVNDGGLIDFSKSSAARVVTNFKQNPGGSLKHGTALTITNWTAPTVPILLTASAV